MEKRVGICCSLLFALILSAGLNSCSEEEFDAEDERKMIESFLKENDIDVEPTESGLYYIELIRGTGLPATTGDTLYVYYTGYYLSGRILDYNRNSDPLPVVLGENSVIEGMEEGLGYMNEGGEALLVIPSKLAYGEEGNFQMGIKPFTPVAFEVTIDKLVPGPEK